MESIQRYTPGMRNGMPVLIDHDSGVAVRYTTHLASLTAAETRAKEAEDALFIPGYLVCDKCAFGGMFSVLSALSGTMSAKDVSDRHVCPNDGSDLRRVTWKERVKDYEKTFHDSAAAHLEAAERTGRALADHVEQLKEAEAENVRLREALVRQARGEMKDGSPCGCDAWIFSHEGMETNVHGEACKLMRAALQNSGAVL